MSSRRNGVDRFVCQRPVRALVVRGRPVVPVNYHAAVALERVECVEGLVDGDLVVVGSEAVAVSVGVGEETALEDGIGGGFDAWDHVRGGECGLFDFGKVVLRVAVEGEFADRAEGGERVRPDFG